jgi:putative tricarboxylic transport membrane protein
MMIAAGLPIFDAIHTVLGVLADPITWLIILIGVVIGVVAGAIPGLGGLAAIAVLIGVTINMDAITAVMFIAALIGGTNQGGAITTILINIPGRAPNAASLLDGYPMTRKGQGERALGIAATASALGAIVGLTVLLLSLPILQNLALLFSPPDIFWLAIWGLATIAVVVRGNVLTGIISGGLGMLLAMPGYSPITGGDRWVFGIAALLDGFRLIPALIGLFAIGEMINLVAKGEKISKGESEIGGNKWEGIKDVFRYKTTFFRASIIGIIIGIIPAVGGTAANFIAYFDAVQASDDPDSFGTGDPRGLVASEASNDAKDGGGYIPTFGFGIPGSPAMVLFLSVMILHGIQPGPHVVDENLDLIVATIFAALIANITSSLMVLLTTKKLIKVVKVDPILLASIIIPITFVASYTINGSYWDVTVAFLFGILGFLMLRIRMSRVPLLLGMVLAPIAEDNFLRTISLGGYSTFVESPISILLILFILFTIISQVLDLKTLLMDRIGS